MSTTFQNIVFVADELNVFSVLRRAYSRFDSSGLASWRVTKCSQSSRFFRCRFCPRRAQRRGTRPSWPASRPSRNPISFESVRLERRRSIPRSAFAFSDTDRIYNWTPSIRPARIQRSRATPIHASELPRDPSRTGGHQETRRPCRLRSRRPGWIP